MLIRYDTKREGIDTICLNDCVAKQIFGKSPITKIGSWECIHCPFCYGRSSNLADWEMIGFGETLTVREVQWVRCSAIVKDLTFQIKIKRFFYQLWVNKLEQFLIKFAKKYNIKPLYNKLNYGWWC